MFALILLTERGDTSSTDVVPDASAVNCPGMGMGSGDIWSVFNCAGSCSPQFCQENPHNCSKIIKIKQ